MKILIHRVLAFRIKEKHSNALIFIELIKSRHIILILYQARIGLQKYSALVNEDITIGYT